MPVERNTFPRDFRIRRNKDFQVILKAGKKRVERHFVIFVRSNGLNHPRLGVAVGKKFGKAVDRNRAKRIVREVFRTRLMRALEPVDVLVLIRKGKGQINFYESLEEIQHALKAFMAHNSRY